MFGSIISRSWLRMFHQNWCQKYMMKALLLWRGHLIIVRGLARLFQSNNYILNSKMGCCYSEPHVSADGSVVEPANPVHYPSRREEFIQVGNAQINKRYEILNTIGQGAFGTVRLAREIATQSMRAIKSIKKSFSQSNFQALRGDLEILKTLDHPNIVRVFEIIEDDNFIHLITEYLEGGELFDRIIEARHFSEKRAAFYFKQVIQAINYCHLNGVMHRDIKPENIMCVDKSEDSQIRLIDFGTSIEIDEKVMQHTLIGTIYYIAPEVLEQNYNEKCDIWSCGVLLYIFLCGYPPFNSRSDDEIRSKILRAEVQFRHTEWNFVSEDTKDLIRWMLKRKPQDRPTAAQVLEHPWLNKDLEDHNDDNVAISSSLRRAQRFNMERKVRYILLSYISTHYTTQQELKELRKAFMAMDTNNNGKLSPEEVTAGIERSRISISDPQQFIRSMDLNQDGEIEYQEFITMALNWQSKVNKEFVQGIFKRFDRDGNGSISLDEVMAAMGGSREANQSFFVELIREMDTNEDGEVDLDEFLDFVYKLIAQ